MDGCYISLEQAFEQIMSMASVICFCLIILFCVAVVDLALNVVGLTQVEPEVRGGLNWVQKYTGRSSEFVKIRKMTIFDHQITV